MSATGPDICKLNPGYVTWGGGRYYMTVINNDRQERSARIERFNRRDEMPCQCSRCRTSTRPTKEPSNG